MQDKFITTQELFLSLCIKKAWDFQGLTLPNPAVGALILDENYNILALQAHQKAGFPHAEVLALLEAFNKLTNQNITLQDSGAIHKLLLENHNGVFHNKRIFLSLEPCNHYGKTPPCALLLSELKPKEIFIGIKDTWGESANGAKRLIESGIKVQFIESKMASDLLLPFLCLQNKGRFNLFKLAMRLDGDYKSGQISCKEAQTFTHNQRSIADSIVISGKTLCNDRPTLDSRFASSIFSIDKKAPNVQILTRSISLAKNPNQIDAPLFKVPNRNIHIANAPQDLHLDSGYNIIEGGFNMLFALKNYIDMILIHISPNVHKSAHSKDSLDEISSLKEILDFEILHTARCGKDLPLWLKPNF